MGVSVGVCGVSVGMWVGVYALQACLVLRSEEGIDWVPWNFSFK